MLFKNIASQKIHIYAYDSTTGAPKTGDAANITAYVSLDGTANAVDDTNPAEVDATNMPGIYCFDLAQAETNCNAFALYAKSSTANIRIEPIIGFTTGAAATQTGDTYAIANGDHGLVSIQDDIDTLLARIVGTIDSGTHKPQSGDAYSLANNGTYGNSALKTLIDAITADTNELQTDLTNGGRLDLLIDAIKAKTDNLPASPASTTNITAGTITTVTNLTNAPANGDFTATMKASITAAVPAAADIKTAMEADGGKLDHLWEMTEDDAGVRRLTANALEQAPTGGSAPSAASIADAVWDEAIADHTSGSTFGGKNQKVVPSETINDYKATGFSTFNPANDTVAHVTLVDTCTTNTDMRGTDSAAPASTALSNAMWTDAKAGYIDAAISSVGGGTPPSAAEIADAVWDEALSGHASSGSSGESLSAAGTAGDPWITALPGSYSAGQAGYIIGNMQNPGSGAIEWTYAVTESSTGLAIPDATVVVTSDREGLTVVASGKTDASGEVTFYLNAGGYYLWRTKIGYWFVNPDLETVA